MPPPTPRSWCMWLHGGMNQVEWLVKHVMQLHQVSMEKASSSLSGAVTFQCHFSTPPVDPGEMGHGSILTSSRNSGCIFNLSSYIIHYDKHCKLQLQLYFGLWQMPPYWEVASESSKAQYLGCSSSSIQR